MKTIEQTNVTHHFYTNADPTLLRQLEQLAKTSAPEEAQTCLQSHLPDTVREEMNYSRLYALLRKDFRDANLSGANLSGMPLSGFTFERAKLTGARFVETNLQGANLADANLFEADLTACDLTSAHLERAKCQHVVAQRVMLQAASLEYSNWAKADLTSADLADVSAQHANLTNARLDHATVTCAELSEANLSYVSARYSKWTGADLRGAILVGADLTWSDLGGTRLEGADLQSCACSGESFGRRWQIDSRTKISVGSHELIGMALLSQARSLTQQRFALQVQRQTALCWKDFVQVLLREQPELIAWAKEVLSAIESLREQVESLERWLGDFQEGLRQRRLARLHDIRSLNPHVSELLRAEVEGQALLSSRELSSYLRGVLAGARQLPDLQLSDEQYQLLDQQLHQMVGEDK